MEEWRTITRRQKGNHHLSKTPVRAKASHACPQLEEGKEEELTEEESQKCIERIVHMKRRLKEEYPDLCRRLEDQCTRFINSSSTSSSSSSSTRSGSIDMICFGLGRISSSDSAAIQFSLLLHLQETLSPSIELVECFDPLFGKNEINICHKFNISVYRDNSRGIFKANGGRVLFYMPHCPYRLYSNVIWSHREHLSNICILGNRKMFIINSFESYELRRIGANDDTDNHVNELTDCMRLALPLTTEKRIFLEEEFKNAMKSSLHDPLLCQFESAFNDMSFMSFCTLEDSIGDLAWPEESEVRAITALDIEVL